MLEPVSVREPKRQPERLMSILEVDSFLSDPGLELDSLWDNVPNEVPALSSEKQDASLLTSDAEVNTNSSDEPNAVSVLANTEEIIGTETFEHHNQESTSKWMMGVLNQPELISACDLTEECIILDGLTANDHSSDRDDHKGENVVKEDPRDKPTEPSLVSVLDSHFEQDPVSAVKYGMKQGLEDSFPCIFFIVLHISCPSLADAELQSSWINFEEQDFGANLENPIVEFIDTTDTGNINTSHVKEEAEFNYVKGLLKKYGFDGGAEEFLAAWYSSCKLIDQLLFVSELETMRYDYSEIPPRLPTSS